MRSDKRILMMTRRYIIKIQSSIMIIYFKAVSFKSRDPKSRVASLPLLLVVLQITKHYLCFFSLVLILKAGSGDNRGESIKGLEILVTFHR